MSRSRLTRTAMGVMAVLGLTAGAVAAAGSASADDLVTHHEFQMNCPVSHTAPDDPIVKPGQPGASHDHTFLGNNTTDAFSTTQSLLAGTTNCIVPADKSAYWFPTMSKDGQKILPNFSQVIYYKTGILDYTKVVPFPQGLRYVTGNAMATQDEFQHAAGAVEGWGCGNSSKNWSFPTSCPTGSQLNIRYQAPSCWDGVNLDLKGNMAYPVNRVCPTEHPVAVPMLEFKIAFPVDGDLASLKLASGAGYSWHFDFFNAWDPATLKALVEHCINGGLQCNPRGFDQYKPDRGGVLDENYALPAQR